MNILNGLKCASLLCSSCGRFVDINNKHKKFKHPLSLTEDIGNCPGSDLEYTTQQYLDILRNRAEVHIQIRDDDWGYGQMHIFSIINQGYDNVEKFTLSRSVTALSDITYEYQTINCDHDYLFVFPRH